MGQLLRSFSIYNGSATHRLTLLLHRKSKKAADPMIFHESAAFYVTTLLLQMSLNPIDNLLVFRIG
jgi:hypothetical protein